MNKDITFVLPFAFLGYIKIVTFLLLSAISIILLPTSVFPQSKAYKEELTRYQDKERADLDKARHRAQEAVSHLFEFSHSVGTVRTPLLAPRHHAQNPSCELNTHSPVRLQQLQLQICLFDLISN